MVTTAGGIEEDLIKCLAPTYKGDFSLPGALLRSKGLNRIGNLLVPNENYCKFEDWIIPIFDQMLKEQIEEVILAIFLLVMHRLLFSLFSLICAYFSISSFCSLIFLVLMVIKSSIFGYEHFSFNFAFLPKGKGKKMFNNISCIGFSLACSKNKEKNALIVQKENNFSFSLSNHLFSSFHQISSFYTQLTFFLSVLQKRSWTPSKVIARLGKEINDENSYLYWAYKASISSSLAYTLATIFIFFIAC